VAEDEVWAAVGEVWVVAAAAWVAGAGAGFGPPKESGYLLSVFARNAVTVNRTNRVCPACRKNAQNAV